MKSNKLIITLTAILAFLTASCQTTKLNFSSLEKDLKEFLIKNGDIHELELEDFKNNKTGINIVGVQNNYSKGDLKNGVYSFSQSRTHAKAYFLIVENEKYLILNISSKEGLYESIKITLDFCERNKYCSEITNDYVSRLIRVYYKINKNPNGRTDINCVNGITDTKNLP